jgi:hypothetical protein
VHQSPSKIDAEDLKPMFKRPLPIITIKFQPIVIPKSEAVMARLKEIAEKVSSALTSYIGIRFILFSKNITH